jgi:hypothetical protein
MEKSFLAGFVERLLPGNRCIYQYYPSLSSRPFRWPLPLRFLIKRFHEFFISPMHVTCLANVILLERNYLQQCAYDLSLIDVNNNIGMSELLAFLQENKLYSSGNVHFNEADTCFKTHLAP